MGREIRHRDSEPSRALKVALTGATGFVGSHVLLELERLGADTVVAVRGSAQPTSVSFQSRVRLDLADKSADPFGILGKPDSLIHLAWSGLPSYESLSHVDTVLPQQFDFLERMVSSGLKHIVVAGTCLEYGLQEGCLSEGMAAEPTTPYGIAKNRLRERLIEMQKSYGFSLTWGRLFYLFGERQNTRSLFSLLKAAHERGDSTFPMTTGQQRRDYLPVSEAARYIVSFGLKPRNHGVVNVCSGVPIKVRDMVVRWIKENRWQINPIFGAIPYNSYEPMDFWGDVRKLHAAIAVNVPDAIPRNWIRQ